MNKQQIYPDMSRKERKEAMKKACYRVEYEVYQAPLPSDELSAEQDAYSRRAIELKKAKDEFAAYKKKKTAELKAIEEEMAIQLEVINTGQREIEGNLYMFQDLQTNDMNYFDANGMFVRSRKIRPEERQTTMAIGNSDVPVSDQERDNQDTEDAQAEDVTNTVGTIGNGPMSSEYEAMAAVANNDEAAPLPTLDDETVVTGTIEERPDNAQPGEQIDEPAGDGKQDEAQAKMDAHKRNKGRMSKAAKAALEAGNTPAIDEGIAATSQGDITAEQNPGGEDDEFKLPE